MPDPQNRAGVTGNFTGVNTYEEAARAQASLFNTAYEAADQVSVSAAASGAGAVSGPAMGLFDTVPYAYWVEIVTDQTIFVRFNAITNDPIRINSAMSPWRIDRLQITNMFLYGGGSNATVNVRIK